MMGDSGEHAILQILAAKLDRDPGTPANDPTESFWQVPQHSFADQQSSTLPTETDVIILGSGITGISVARHLLRLHPDLRICMIEARAAISGATGRNGGHIKAVPYADYYALKKALGKDSAIKITNFRLAHLNALVDEAAELGEAGKVGLVRRVEGVSAFFDQETWNAGKEKLETWLRDCPEQRGRWTFHEGENELKV
jgi:glycine/D-amino acid oxidase-like deaminating enzyme